MNRDVIGDEEDETEKNAMKKEMNGDEIGDDRNEIGDGGRWRWWKGDERDEKEINRDEIGDDLNEIQSSSSTPWKYDPPRQWRSRTRW